jgi:DNA-binding NarL/FixJ family response regulator
MISAVKFMSTGETYAPFEFMKSESAASKANLSTREADVLQGICEGKANKEIARDLDLQEVTIKLHVKTLSRKLGARNRTHAAMIARDRSLI